MPRSASIPEAAEQIGCSASFLYEHRRGDVIELGDQRLHLIRAGRGWRVPSIEVARFLREAPPLEAAS